MNLAAELSAALARLHASIDARCNALLSDAIRQAEFNRRSFGQWVRANNRKEQ